METRTAAIALEADRDVVFDFVADVDNITRWATEFAQALRREDGEAIVTTDRGDMVFRIEADRDTGVVDMLAGPDPERLQRFPTRVVPLDSDRTAYLFTMFRAPDMPAAAFEREYRSLEKELQVLRRELDA